MNEWMNEFIYNLLLWGLLSRRKVVIGIIMMVIIIGIISVILLLLIGYVVLEMVSTT